MVEALVISSFLFVLYTYFGYPALLFGLRKKSSIPLPSFTPSVSVVIAAQNEVGPICDTLRTILNSDYPESLLEIYVVSDASTDGTDEAVKTMGHPRIHVLRQSEKGGQAAALLVGAQASQSEILIIADASGRFQNDTVKMFVRNFAEPKVGAVSGFKAIKKSESAVAEPDGLYARYDLKLRLLETELGSSWVGCAGGVYAIRRHLFVIDFPLDIATDMALGYRLYEKGFVHRIDPNAVILESASKDLTNEFRRKVRIIVMQLRGMVFFRHLFIPWKHPGFVFQNASHKIFRWLVPYALIIQWTAAGFSDQAWCQTFFNLQTGFYFLALVGILWERHGKAPMIFGVPAYFVVVNMGGLLAWPMLYRDYTVWQPPVRVDTKPS